MSFFLKTPDKPYSAIWHRDNKNKRQTTGIIIPTKYWDKEKQVVKRAHPHYKEINKELSDFVSSKPKKELLLPFYLEWATKGTATKLTPRRGDLYSYNVMAEFTNSATFEDVNYTFCNNFVQFLQRKGLAMNTIGTHIRNLKAVMNEAYKRGLHTNTAYKFFRKPSEEVDSVYLTEEELQKIRDLELSGREEKARDLFLIGCNTAMRYSDYSRLTKDWIDGGEIRFISTKTSARQTIPLAEEVKTILEKYNGYAPYVNEQFFNKTIKDICREAGIDTPVQTVKTVGREKVVSQQPKWKLVSSHTARRTAATLLIKRGAPIAWVMSLTGHKTESAFWKYVRLSKEEYAKLLKSYIK